MFSYYRFLHIGFDTMVDYIKIVNEYEAFRKREALCVRLDENATWEEIFDRNALLACETARKLNVELLQRRRIKATARFTWNEIMVAWELLRLDRLRKEKARISGLTAKTATWEEIIKVPVLRIVKQGRFMRDLNKCRKHCPLTSAQKEELRQRQAIAVGLPITSRWKPILKEKTNQGFNQDMEMCIRHLGLSSDSGFEDLYDYINSRFASPDRQKEAISLGLNELATWDEIFKAKVLHNLNQKLLKEIAFWGFDDKATWDDVIKNQYFIELDISREEAAKELHLPFHASWDQIIVESFKIKLEE